MSNIDTIRGRITITIRSHGYFMNITGPCEYTVSGGVRCVKTPGEKVVEGSVVWHDGDAVLTFGRPDVDGYFSGDTHEIRVGDQWKGIDATKLLDAVTEYVTTNDELRKAVLGELTEGT